MDGLLEETQDSLLDLAQMVPTPEPLKPIMRTVAEGDTIKGIAEEYSVSINTILASNKIEDPDVIKPGQDLLIPPVEGLVAEVEAGESLGQLAERVGVATAEIAQANGLPNDPGVAIPYERVVVPGSEPAERAAAPRRKPPVSVAARGEVGTALASAPSPVLYEVQPGDTLVQLSAQFGVSIPTILQANSISNPDSLTPGTQLKVLPVNGVEHEVRTGETLNDIATHYEVDLGPLVDFNAVENPNSLQVGAKLTVPGTVRPPPADSLAGSMANVALAPSSPPAQAAARAPTAAQSAQAPRSAPVVAAQPARSGQAAAEAPKPASRAMLAQQAKPEPAPLVPASKPELFAPPKPQPAASQAASKPQAVAATQPGNKLAAASVIAPKPVTTGGNGSVLLAGAMRHLGARYAFGGTSPAGFDCSGFVWYVHNSTGKSVSRGLWGQMNGGPRISRDALQPGDTVFFANTYMPGLSHAGIYVGGGRFIHAADERSGVTISGMDDGYWGPRYIGASRLW